VKKIIFFSLITILLLSIVLADYNPPMISTNVSTKGLIKLDKNFAKVFDLSNTKSGMELRNIVIPSIAEYKASSSTSYSRLDLTFDSYQYKFLVPYLKIDIYSNIKKSSNYYYGKKIYSDMIKVQRVNSNKYVFIVRFNTKELIINSKTYDITSPIVIKLYATKFVPERFNTISILYSLEIPKQTTSNTKVQFTSSPSGAVVYLGAKMLGVTPFYAYLKPGSYVVRFFKSGYPQQNVKFTASGQYTNVDASFIKKILSNKGSVKLSIDPPDATIMFNGKLSPQNVFTLPAGTYSVSISADGYESQVFTFKVVANKTTTYFVKLKQKMATLILNINPNDSKVYINGKYYAGNVFKLPPSIYNLLIKHDGYKDYSFAVNLAPDEVMKVPVVLQQLKGFITINSNILSKVYINGKYVGDTNITNFALDPGSYDIEIVNGSFDLKTKVQVEAGKTKTINVNVSID
jgi:hypothetical protein